MQVTEGFNGFCYVYEGAGKIGGSSAHPQHALVLGPGELYSSSTMEATSMLLSIHLSYGS